MKPVSVSELKARLSYYLRQVRRGGEVQVLDRGRPVARLVGISGGGRESGVRQELVARGIIRPGNGGAREVLPPEPLDGMAGLGRALDQDRADRL